VSELTVAINLVLYLCAEEPDVHDRTEGLSRAQDAYGDPRGASTWDVGIRIGTVIRKYENAPLEDDEQALQPPSGPGHASPRPHIRRAHWHAFWMGPKDSPDRRLTVHWLPPIPVGIDWRQELPVIVHPVK
jgi:hypothetical protein